MILENILNSDMDPSDMIYSEKVDGVRAFWDGKHLTCKQGIKINAPHDFIRQLPTDIMLDGELCLKQGCIEECLSIVQTLKPDGRWENIKYQVFDTPNSNGGILQRLEYVHDKIGKDCKSVTILHHGVCKNKSHFLELMRSLGSSERGKGIMLRNPTSPYDFSNFCVLLEVIN